MMRRASLSSTMALAGLLACSGAVMAQSPSLSAPQQGSLPTGPLVGDQDLSPFYRWTQPLPAEPGKMLRQEPMPAQAEIAAAGMANRILYTSTDLRWHAGIVPVSGTIYLPKGEPPSGGWPLVAWAHGTLGVADSCAPSWTGHKPRDATYINHWLENGFAVVATDYQGLGGPGPHPYLIWEAEGRSVLDGVRAALATYSDKLAHKVFVTGQSQGSGAALGATRIAPTYAPDVPLQATVATGVVSTFPDFPYKPPQRAVPSMVRYVVLTMIGGSLPDGAPSPDALATDKGKALLKAAREGCSAEVNTAIRHDGITDANAFVEPLNKIVARLTPVTDMSIVRLPVPVMLGTGLADRTLVPRRQYAAVAALCSAGNDIVWKTYVGATHNGGLNASFPDALAFFRAALAGNKPTSTCNALVEPAEPTIPATNIPFND
ncbi:Secretory lipase [Enhydrobacter aerosaccus]|uniref:Secretory lipase n=1 Tax=Enhydrobacter aerosaccus TaxID=225324 RepID=A0A1T4TF69_9HYPH|nr:lipase family protein [Enhydrobacter aerosaccus]SKA38898.1 Secretory lipase [Enhydrobacter aerosaccus]